MSNPLPLSFKLVVATVAVLAGGMSVADAASLPITMQMKYRSYDGSKNNVLHSDWGKSGMQLMRKAAAAYANGFSSPAGALRPSPRAISNAVMKHAEGDLKNNRQLSALVYVFGQFLDHDIDLTPPAAAPKEAFNIAVPLGDVSFDPLGTGTKTIGLDRSMYDPATGTRSGNPRQQITTVSSWIDGSQIYGSDATRAMALRTGVGGKLKTSAGNLMPFNTMGLENQILPGGNPTQFFAAGDIRANENIDLVAVHTLFVREHNYQADRLSRANPKWNDEEVYQNARRYVVGELQAITYKEWLPALLGPNALRSYRGYQPMVNPSITNEFSTASFRFGHSLLGADVEFIGNDGLPVPGMDEVALRDAFFNAGIVVERGVDPILKYLASDLAEEVDTFIVDDVRDFLFGPPGSGGFDLASLNIQRGRDHGLSDYNTTRRAYGLPALTNFNGITANVALRASLQTLYGNVNNIDLWLGGLAEDHVSGGSTGPLLRAVLADQFERLRDGDRFWYQVDFSGADLKALEATTMAQIIRRNTSITNLQNNPFFFSEN